MPALEKALAAVLNAVGLVRGVVPALLSLQFLSSGFSLLRYSQFTKEFAWGALKQRLDRPI